MVQRAARNSSRRNPSGYVSCDGFDAVMMFIAETSGEDASLLWLKLAQASAKDHGMKVPRPAKEMNCRWLLKKLEAVTPEAQWDLVSRAEPLFHSAWEGSRDASSMIKCATLLYPPRDKTLSIVNDEVRLATCDVVATVLEYNMDPRVLGAFDVARKYALRQASYNELYDARNAVLGLLRNYEARDVRAVLSAVSWLANSNESYFNEWDGQASATRTAARVSGYRSGYDIGDNLWKATLLEAEARNADIVRKSLGTPGLALLMR